jgi:hypothetical protein
MATATTAPTGILSNIDLKNFDLNDLAKIAKLIGRRTALGSVFVPTTMGDATLDNYTPEQLAAMINVPGVTTGSELEKESKEDREKKKEERKKTLAGVKGSRAAGMRGDELEGAIERGDFDAYLNPFMTPDPDAGKPQIETFPELTEAEKLPQTTGGGVIDINELINKPLIMAQDPDAGKATILSTPTLSPEDQLPTIFTMAKIKDKDLVYVGGDINAKLPKYFVDESGKLKPEYQKKGNEGEDADKLIDVRAGYKLPKYMLNEIKFTRTKNKGKPNEKVVQDTKYTIKDEYKNPEELKRLQDSQKLKNLMTEYFEQNPSSYDILYKTNQSGKKELQQIQKFFKENHNIDFDVDTYEKFISQTYGSREKEAVGRSVEKIATDKFKKIINDYSKDKFGESLTTPQMDRYLQEFRIGLKVEYPDRVKGQEYTNEEVSGVTNLIIDTVFKGKYREKFDIGYDADLGPYIQNKLDRMEQNKKMFEEAKAAGASKEELARMKKEDVIEIGHYGKVKDRIPGEGGDLTQATNQTKKLNQETKRLDNAHAKMREKNDIDGMVQIEQQMKDLGIRSKYINENGDTIFIGAEPEIGKLKDGGMVGISHLIRPL